MSPQLLALTFLLISIAHLDKSASDGIHSKQYFCRAKSIATKHQDAIDVFTIEKATSKVNSNMTCKYPILFVGQSKHLFYTQILSADVVPDHSLLEIYEIRDGQRFSLLRESKPNQRNKVFISRTDRLTIVFTTLFYPARSNSTGYHIRLTPFTTKVCPPDWTQLGSYCFSQTSAMFMTKSNELLVQDTKVDFYTAQYMCNRMRANLLVASQTVLKGSGVKDLGDLMLKLQFKDPVWIGLIDYSDAGERKLYWLDDSTAEASELQEDWLSCHTDELKIPGGCESTERFAYLRPTRSGFLVFDRPEKQHQFACFAPVGMTDNFFPTHPSTSMASSTVPDVTATASSTSEASPGISLLDIGLIGILLLFSSILSVVCLLQCGNCFVDDAPNTLTNAYNEVNPHQYTDDENSISSRQGGGINNNQSTQPDEAHFVNGSVYSADSQQAS